MSERAHTPADVRERVASDLDEIAATMRHHIDTFGDLPGTSIREKCQTIERAAALAADTEASDGE